MTSQMETAEYIFILRQTKGTNTFKAMPLSNEQYYQSSDAVLQYLSEYMKVRNFFQFVLSRSHGDT